MGDYEPVKEQNDGSSPDPNSGVSVGIRSINQRRRAWEETEQESESGTNRPIVDRDIATVEGLREAVNRSTPGSKWNEIAIVVGVIALVFCIGLTLITVLGVNARANKLLANAAIRAREGGAVAARVEKKIDDGANAVNENAAKLDALVNQHATSTTIAVNGRPTATTRPGNTTTATTARRSPPPTTARPSPPPPPPPTTPATAPPCRLALLSLCVLE